MKLIFSDIVNVTLHISERKLRVIDKMARDFNTSRNKLILYCIEYAIDNQNFINSAIEKK